MNDGMVNRSWDERKNKDRLEGRTLKDGRDSVVKLLSGLWCRTDRSEVWSKKPMGESRLGMRPLQSRGLPPRYGLECLLSVHS